MPAVFQDNHTFYLPPLGNERGDWRPVRYGTQVSVLPRFTESNQIELRLDVEDGRQMRGGGGQYTLGGRAGWGWQCCSSAAGQAFMAGSVCTR
jgi:type III secretion protein C